MSRIKNTLLMATVLAVALTGCGGGSDSAPDVAPADLVLRGGVVATVDPAIRKHPPHFNNLLVGELRHRMPVAPLARDRQSDLRVALQEFGGLVAQLF